MKNRFTFLVLGILLLMMYGFENGRAYGQTAIPPALGDGSSTDPYQIATLDNLYWITQNTTKWDKHYIQTADIDASSSSAWNSGAGWNPIGNNTTKFLGSYNGQDFEISGLTIVRAASYQGMFGYINGGTVSNLELTNCNYSRSGTTGYSYWGCLAGYLNNATITNVHVQGSINSPNTGYIGGLFGYGGGSGSTYRDISNCSANCTITGNSNLGGFGGSTLDYTYLRITSCHANVTLEGSGGSVGGFIGNCRCRVTECYSEGTVGEVSGSSSNSNYGGFIGALGTTGTINRCYTTCDVNAPGKTIVAGFYAYGGGTVNDCYSRGDVLGSQWIGGFCANSQSGTVSRSYCTGSVNEGTTGGGGFCHYGGTFDNCFWDKETSGKTTSSGSAVGKTTEQMNYLYTYLNATWDFGMETINGSEDKWAYDPSVDCYPILSFQNLHTYPATPSGSGTLADPYQIGSFSDLYWLSRSIDSWNKSIIQTADIDASPCAAYCGGGWLPIGISTIKFTGNYNGQGYSISGIGADRDEEYQGFFGWVNGGSISNLNISNISISRASTTLLNYWGGLAGRMEGGTQLSGVTVNGTINNAAGNYTGGLAGHLTNVTINDCHTECTVNGNDYAGGFFGYATVVSGTTTYWDITASSSNSTVSGRTYVGGFGGWTFNSSYLRISGGFADVSVTGSGSYVGGFIGYCQSPVTECYSWGSLCEATGSGNSYGGFVGYLTNALGEINRCYSTCEVSVPGKTYVGGFAGHKLNSSKIYDSYSRGNVTGSTSSNRGGFVGYNVSAIARCYSTGLVNSSPSGGGGFCGANGSGGTITNCFWDKETSGYTTSPGGSGVTAKTTLEMKTQSTFTDAGWDFATIWIMDGIRNNGYAYLQAVPTTQSNVWTGNLNTDWEDDANWTDGIPGSYDDVIIPDVSLASGNFPVVAGNASCFFLTVDPGASLTITPTGALSANGVVTNNGSLLIQSDAGGTGSFIDKGLINGSGSSTVELYLTAGRYHSFSAPVTNAVSGIFDLPNGEADIFLYRNNEATYNYTEIPQVDVPLNTMEGYMVYVDGSVAVPPVSSEVFAFTGNLATGALGSANNALISSPGGLQRGWNFFGNPYPSAIDWAATSGWTKTNLDATIYIYNNGNWATWNSESGGTNGGSNNIATGQGFFVKVTDPGSGYPLSGTLQMDNNVRVHHNAGYLKSGSPSLKLSVSGNGKTDETAILFHHSATHDFDPAFDGYKILSSVSGFPQIYSIAAYNLAVNVLPQTEVIPLNVTNVRKGELLTISKVSNPAGYTLFLEDKYTHTVTDLNSRDYTFSYVDGMESRFNLHFVPFTPLSNGNVNIYVSGRDLHILGADAQSKVMLYDITGKMLGTYSLDGVNNTIILDVQPGVYMVKVSGTHIQETGKVIVQ